MELKKDAEIIFVDELTLTQEEIRSIDSSEEEFENE